MKAESDIKRTEKSGDIKQSFSKVVSVQEKALVGAFNLIFGYAKSGLLIEESTKVCCS